MGRCPGYLLGIARHHILKRLSAAQRESAIDSEVVEEIASDETAALEGMSREEAVQAVRAAIQSLPLVYREIVTLCELEELDYATAAACAAVPDRDRAVAPASREGAVGREVGPPKGGRHVRNTGSSQGYVGSGFSRTSGGRRS